MTLNYFSFSSIELGREYIALIDPDTLFWVTSKKSKINEAKSLFRELYTSNIKNKLNEDKNDLFNSVGIDMIEVHPTEKCNMDCEYCYIPRKYRLKDRCMSVEEIEFIITKILDFLDQNPDKGMKRIIFHGGEPLIAKKQIFEVMDRYYKEVEFGIQTNGTLLTEEDSEFIKERNIHISFSIDGPLDIHNITRKYWNGKGTYYDVLKSIKYFKDYFWLGAIVTITKYNVNNLNDIAKDLHKIGIPSSIFNPVSPCSSSACSLMPSTEDLIYNYKKLIDTNIEINSNSINGKRFVIDNIESILMCLLTSNLRVLYCNMSPCGAGRLVYIITSNGDVYSCSEFMAYPEFKSGNVFKNSIREIINSDPCRLLRSRKVDMIEECKLCPYKNICGANCPAAVYYLNQKLLEKSPHCKFMKEMINYIFLKIAEGGLAEVYKLVSNNFEKELRKSEKLVYHVK